jgi:hypothetical protein
LLIVGKAHVVDSSPLKLQLKKERQSFSIKQTFPNSSKKQEAIVITKLQVDLFTKCDPWNNGWNLLLLLLLLLRNVPTSYLTSMDGSPCMKQ